MSSEGLDPDIRLLLEAVSPRVASLAQWWEERRKVKIERYLLLVDLADVTEVENLLARSLNDEELGDFVETLIGLAIQNSARHRSEAFGRLLHLVASDLDDSPPNEAWLLLNAIADLDPPHLRILRRLRREGDRYRGISDYELAEMFERGTTMLYPMLKTLERHGLAGPLRPAEPGDPDGSVEWAIWDFGILLLELLFPESESEPETSQRIR